MPDNEIEGLEKKKAALIERYLELQQRVDDLNEQVYRLTVEIAQLNARIERARLADPRPAK
ncbi:MAG: hypothetical protein HYY18_20755 [Planctomycetes bacterium]|nr:hypothetical protein [Planctomycetota bacterium]